MRARTKMYVGVFDRYDFRQHENKIVLRNIQSIKGDHYIGTAYIDANVMKHIIGELTVGECLQFSCKGVVEEKLINPVIINHIKRVSA